MKHKNLPTTSYLLPTRRAFTLIEILIATAILSVIVGVCAFAFKTATDVWTKAEARFDRYQNARAALEMMAREISSAVIMAHSIYHIDLVYRNDAIVTHPFEFLFVAPVDSGATFDLVGLGYWHNPGNRTLYRRIQTTHPSGNWWRSGTWNMPLTENATSLSFEFYNHLGEIRSNWDSRDSAERGGLPVIGATENRLPRAVKITITVQDPRGIEGPQTFSTMAYIGAAD